MTEQEAALKIINTCGAFAFVKGEDLSKLALFLWEKEHLGDYEDEDEEAESLDNAFNLIESQLGGYDLAYSDFDYNCIWFCKLLPTNSAN